MISATRPRISTVTSGPSPGPRHRRLGTEGGSFTPEPKFSSHVRNMNSTYDLIVVGGGHNGLVTAAYVAGTGASVLVLERRELLGGACVTEELWPGFKVSTAAYVNSLLRPEIIRDLELK